MFREAVKSFVNRWTFLLKFISIRWDLSRAHHGANYAPHWGKTLPSSLTPCGSWGFQSSWWKQAYSLPCVSTRRCSLWPSHVDLSPALQFPHTCTEPSPRALVSSLRSLCAALSLVLYPVTFSCLHVPGLPALSPYSEVYLRSPSLGRKLGWERDHCTCTHLSGAPRFAAWCKVSLNCCFVCFIHDLVVSRERVSPVSVIPSWPEGGIPEVWLQQAPPGTRWLHWTHQSWAWPAFHLAYFDCCVMSDFRKLEFITCAMRKM